MRLLHAVAEGFGAATAGATLTRRRRKTRGRVLMAVALACAAVTCRANAEPIAAGDEVVITAPSASGTVRTTPHGVSVISEADIARSTATSVPELLSRAANLNLQSFTGNAKKAVIDMRGMGATAGSNVLVLVDGERLNETDSSGADLSTIPMSQIERVEIIRGGGSVRYGSGAVGGVINIITKHPAPDGQLHLDLLGRVGSYETTDLRANLSAGTGAFAGAVNASSFNTNGYRQNNAVSARDGAAELHWFPAKLGLSDVSLRAAHHEDTTGLPGPVSAQAFAAGPDARRVSNAPFDTSSTTDDLYSLGTQANIGTGGLLSLKLSYRDRDNPYVIGYTPLLSPAAQRSLITSQRKDARIHYDQQFEALGLPQTITAGVDLQRADFLRADNGTSNIGSSTRRTGSVDWQGYYTSTTLRAPHGFALNAGVRADHFHTDVQDSLLMDCPFIFPGGVPVRTSCVNTFQPLHSQGGTWNNRAFDIGLTWDATASITGFASVSRNFRNPNLDELILAADTLRPQTGRTVEVGLRYSQRDNLELSATVFHMKINDEIYFGLDPQTGTAVNRNFDQPTRRVGGELEARWRALTTLSVRASVGYVAAQFEGSDAYVPLVPRTTANAELQWAPKDWLQWLFSARYVGRRFDGNDFTNNQYPVLPSYVVCDTAVRLQRGRFELSVGINNLFNQVYSTIGYSATYYPMPDRNFYVQLRAKL
ncbi:MAG: TonB-dependent receptor [Betaproteobacteria bacterium]